MNYDLHMGAALAEAAEAIAAGELGDGAVAVLDAALVATARPSVAAACDPTAHAVVNVVRAAARRLGRTSLAGVTVFVVAEPCALCVAALVAADVDGVVFAVGDARSGACGGALRLADVAGDRRLRVVGGILRDRAVELRPDLDDRPAVAARRA